MVSGSSSDGDITEQDPSDDQVSVASFDQVVAVLNCRERLPPIVIDEPRPIAMPLSPPDEDLNDAPPPEPSNLYDGTIFGTPQPWFSMPPSNDGHERWSTMPPSNDGRSLFEPRRAWLPPTIVGLALPMPTRPAPLTPDLVVEPNHYLEKKCRKPYCRYTANPEVAGDYCCGCCKGWDQGSADETWNWHGKKCEGVYFRIPSTPAPEWARQTVRAMQTGRSLEMRLENEEFRDLNRRLTDSEFDDAGGPIHTDDDIANAMQDDGVDEALNVGARW